MEIDHFESIAAGGCNDLSNLVPACKRCNRLKLAVGLEVFRTMLAYIEDPGGNVVVSCGTNWVVQRRIRQFQFYFERAGLTIGE